MLRLIPNITSDAVAAIFASELSAFPLYTDDWSESFLNPNGSNNEFPPYWPLLAGGMVFFTYHFWERLPSLQQLGILCDLIYAGQATTLDELPLPSHFLDFETENEYELRLKKINFSGEIPDEFKCPVHKGIMENPVILITQNLQSAHSIDEVTAKMILQIPNPLCPLTRQPFNQYILNRDLKNLLEKWVIKQEQQAQIQTSLLTSKTIFARPKSKTEPHTFELRRHSIS